MSVFRFLFSLFLAAGFLGCSTVPPKKEYAFAQAALNACIAAEAQRYSPDGFQKAESLFRRAQRAYQQEDYSDSKKLFEQSRILSEKVEVEARQKKIKVESGQ